MSHSIEVVVLRNACALLDERSRWTSGAWARDRNGERCGVLSERAHQWCAWGALQKCAYDLVGHEPTARQIANKISRQLVPGAGGLIFVNERGGYDTVRMVMRLGAPPVEAAPTWPFPDFRERRGFGVFSRSGS